MASLRTATWCASGALVLSLTGCSCDAGNIPPGEGGGGSTSSSQGGDTFAGGGGSTGSFGGSTSSGPIDVCKVNDSGSDNAVTPCVEVAPADSFAPEVQWSWTAPPPSQPNPQYIGSFSTPLVGNFTDDNGDGAIDLCDIPDILVTSIDSVDVRRLFARAQPPPRSSSCCAGHGLQQLEFPTMVDRLVYGALGDIDADGVSEIVWADTTGTRRVRGRRAA
jgi:hypothetical protein